MTFDLHRWAKRVAIVGGAIIAMAVAGLLAVPHLLEILGERALRGAGFPAADLQEIDYAGVSGIRIGRIALAPDGPGVLTFEDVVVQADPARLLEGRLAQIRIGAVRLKSRMVEGTVALPGRMTDAAAGAPASLGPEALPVDTITIGRVDVVLALDEEVATLSVTDAEISRTDAALIVTAGYRLAHPAGQARGAADVLWGAGGTPLVARMTVTDGRVAVADLTVQALEGEGRMALTAKAPPVARLSVKTGRAKTAGRDLGALALDARWQADALSLRLEGGDGGPAALSIAADGDVASRSFVGRMELSVPELSALPRLGAEGRARAAADIRGQWPEGAMAPSGTGTVSLSGEELALPGALSRGRFRLAGEVAFEPGRMTLRSGEPWTAAFTPAPDVIPEAAARLRTEPLRARIALSAPLVLTMGTKRFATGGVDIGLEGPDGVRLSVQAPDFEAGAQKVAVPALTLSAARLPLGDLRLAIADYRGGFDYDGRRASLSGSGRIGMAGTAAGTEIEEARLHWAGSLTAGPDRVVLRPEGCTRLSVAALSFGGIRLEGLALPCLKPCRDGVLAQYRRGARSLSLAVAAEPAPLAVRLVLDGRAPQAVDGQWPAVSLSANLRGGTVAVADMRAGQGRLRLPAAGVRLDGLTLSAAIKDGLLTGGEFAIETVADTAFPPLWAPLGLGARASRPLANAPYRFKASLSDSLGTFILQAEGEGTVQSGAADLTLFPVSFIPGATEIADISPRLALAMREVTGDLSFDGRLGWDPSGFDSAGTLRMSDFGFKLTESRIAGLTSEVFFSSLIPPSTPEGQIAVIDRVDAGVPLTDGRAAFTLEPDLRLAVRALRFEMAGGTLAAEPFTVDLSDPSTLRLAVRADNVELADVLAISGIEGLSGQGRLSGRIPVALSADGARIEQGSLDAGRDGVVRYTPEELPSFLRSDDLQTQMLRNVLKDYRYEQLSLGISGSINEEQRVRFKARGGNPDFLDGHPVELDVSFQGPLVSVLRSALAPYRAEGAIDQMFPQKDSEESEK